MRSLKFIFLCYILFTCIIVLPVNGEKSIKVSTSVDVQTSSKFLYFSYGSNMLAERIHVKNPTAVKKTIAQLKNYRLDFNTQSIFWKGAGATIVPTENSTVWGVLWEIDNSNMASLDQQEGVAYGRYFPLTVKVEAPNGEILECRTYQQVDNPKEHVELNSLPQERRPSKPYLDVVLRGARENQLPGDYIKSLEAIVHNG